MGSISRTCKDAEFHTMSAVKRKVKRLVNNYARCPDAGEGEEQTLMALVTTEKMLKDAQAGHYAVGAFNVENLEFVMAVLAAAEETKSPVIMQTTPGTIKTAGLDYFYGMVKAAAERASVPVALHLDHGDGYDRCMQAFRTGYTSVMIDGSHESFEDNIALTKSVADAGRAMGVPVEAELGKVGGKEDDGPAVEGESPYTDPAEAKEFVERTGCTSLAIGVGTSHGVYTSDPHIEQSVVKAIRDAVDVPLVLHGTSGVPDVRIFEAAKAGDPICQEELDRLADLLGMGIANICFVINPERIILGGGIMEQEAYMKPRIEAALEKYLVSQIWKHTTVCMAAYQNNAGMLGALYHLQAELSR